MEKPKRPYLPEQMAVYCLLLRTNTCLPYGIETSLKFLCVSFTEKRNLGRPFDIINYTPTSQLCLDKLDIVSWRSGREKPSQCFNIRLGIFETRTNQRVHHRGYCQLSVWMPEFTRMHYKVFGRYCLEPANRTAVLLGIAPQDLIKVDVFHPVVIARLCLQ